MTRYTKNDFINRIEIKKKELKSTHKKLRAIIGNSFDINIEMTKNNEIIFKIMDYNTEIEYYKKFTMKDLTNINISKSFIILHMNSLFDIIYKSIENYPHYKFEIFTNSESITAILFKIVSNFEHFPFMLNLLIPEITINDKKMEFDLLLNIISQKIHEITTDDDYYEKLSKMERITNKKYLAKIESILGKNF